MISFIRIIYNFIKRTCCFCCSKKRDSHAVMNQYFYEDSVQTNYVVCDV